MADGGDEGDQWGPGSQSYDTWASPSQTDESDTNGFFAPVIPATDSGDVLPTGDSGGAVPSVLEGLGTYPTGPDSDKTGYNLGGLVYDGSQPYGPVTVPVNDYFDAALSGGNENAPSQETQGTDNSVPPPPPAPPPPPDNAPPANLHDAISFTYQDNSTPDNTPPPHHDLHPSWGSDTYVAPEDIPTRIVPRIHREISDSLPGNFDTIGDDEQSLPDNTPTSIPEQGWEKVPLPWHGKLVPVKKNSTIKAVDKAAPALTYGLSSLYNILKNNRTWKAPALFASKGILSKNIGQAEMDSMKALLNYSLSRESTALPIILNLFPQISIQLIDTNSESETTTDIQNFISIIELLEHNYTEQEQRNTKFMITQFRKAFYNSSSFNTMLIPDTDQENNNCRLSVTDKTKLNSNRIVKELDSAKIDIAHVFVGLDAFNHQGSINRPYLAFWIKISRSFDAATWLGDLASVIYHVREDIYGDANFIPKVSDQDIDSIWKKAIGKNAPASDLLGDIDGIVLGAYLAVQNMSYGKKVSEILRDYYLQENNTHVKAHRMQYFAQAIGLGDLTPNGFQNEAAFVRKYQHEITDATLLLIAQNSNITMYQFIAASYRKFYDDPLLNVKCGSFVLKAFIKALSDNWGW